MSAEYIPTVFVILAAGVFAAGIVVLFRTFGPRRKVSDDYRAPNEPTGWILRWGQKPAPVRPDQLTVYTGTARVHAIEGRVRDAEVVSYEDERTRLVTR